MRRIASALFVTSLLLGGAACGKEDTASDSSSGEKQSTEQKSTEQKSSSSGGDLTGFIDGFSDPNDGIATRDEAECVAGKIEGDISDAGRKILNTKESDGSELSDADAELIFPAVDDCITLDKIVAKLQKLLAADSGADGVEQAKCLGDAMRSEYSSSGEVVRDSFEIGQGGAGQTDNTLTKLITTCSAGAGGEVPPTDGGSGGASEELKNSVFRVVSEQMLTRGLDAPAAYCVADAVSSEASAADLAEIAQSGALPQSIEDLITEVTGPCGG